MEKSEEQRKLDREQRLKDWVKALAGDNADKIDVHAHVDMNLNVNENKSVLKQAYPDLLKQVQTVQSVKDVERKAWEQDQERLSEEMARREAAALEEIRKATDAGPQLTKFFGDLRLAVEAFAKSKVSALVLEGPPGMGKSFTVSGELARHGWGDRTRIISGHATMLRIYESLYRNRDGVVVFDDIPLSTLRNPLFTAILKAACWSTTGERTVRWQSTSKILAEEEIPQEFQFSGKIVLLCNHLPDTEEIQAVVDRGMYRRVIFSTSGVKELFLAMAKQPLGTSLTDEQRAEVAEFLVGKITQATQGVSLRLLIKAMYFREWSPDHWQKVVSDSLEVDEDKAAAINALRSCVTAREQVHSFLDATGKSRATFFRLKRLLKAGEVF